MLACASGYPRALHSFPTRRSSDLDASNLSDAATARDAISVLTFSFVGLVTELLAILGSNGDGWATSLSSGLIAGAPRSEEHTSELQSRLHLVCRLLLEKKKENRA